MSYINMKSRRSFDFYAPYNEEGERLVTIPFPVAVDRKVEKNGIVHDANPALVTVDVDTKVQPGSLLIVRNEGAAVATVGGANCAQKKVTTLMWDGNAYAELATSAIS